MIQQNLIKAFIGVLALISVMAVLGFVYEDEMTAVTTWVVDRVGFLGLAVILMVTDTLVTPFPPDILLAVIAKSPLSDNWPVYVGILRAQGQVLDRHSRPRPKPPCVPAGCWPCGQPGLMRSSTFD